VLGLKITYAGENQYHQYEKLPVRTCNGNASSGESANLNYVIRQMFSHKEGKYANFRRTK